MINHHVWKETSGPLVVWLPHETAKDGAFEEAAAQETATDL